MDPAPLKPTAGGHRHIHDVDGHLVALESDLEYFRRKRLEPRVLFCLRRGVISFADLLRADDPAAPAEPWPSATTIEAGIRSAEDELDRLVRGIALVTTGMRTLAVSIDDTRRERGDYDPFFRIAKRPHGAGSPAERLRRIGPELADAHRLLAAFTAALLAAGQLTSEELAQRRRVLEDVGYRNGARIVARAWVDPEFKHRLLQTGRAAVRELDIPPGRLGLLGVAENTDEVHNVVVCTLCSCYPHDLLGNPPWWYRSDEYKERIVREPRAALAEMFGLALAREVRIRVHDSTSDVRWMVLPQRPPGTADLTEDELADLITPESLVGAGLPLTRAERSGRP